MQINLWWLMHMTALCWKVFLPVQARSLQSSRRLKLVHILCVLVGLLVPLIPVLAPIISNAVMEARLDQPIPGSHGFGFALFPPILCSGIHEDVTFYTLILPNVLIILVGTVTMVLTIRKIHKVYMLDQITNLL